MTRTKEEWIETAKHLLSPEAEQLRNARRRIERMNILTWLGEGNKLSIRNGEDSANVCAREGVVVAPGRGYHFDLYHDARCIGYGHVGLYFCDGNVPRDLDWHLFTRGGETLDLGEELWRRAGLDKQLPPHFRRGRKHPPDFTAELEADIEDILGSLDP